MNISPTIIHLQSNSTTTTFPKANFKLRFLSRFKAKTTQKPLKYIQTKLRLFYFVAKIIIHKMGGVLWFLLVKVFVLME